MQVDSAYKMIVHNLSYDCAKIICKDTLFVKTFLPLPSPNQMAEIQVSHATQAH